MQSFTVTFLTLGAGVIAAFLFSLVAVSAKPSLPRLPKLEALALVILVAALGLRVGLSGQGFELEVDAGTFKAWSAAVARLGVHGLYASEMMVDYPPSIWPFSEFSARLQHRLGWPLSHPGLPACSSAVRSSLNSPRPLPLPG